MKLVNNLHKLHRQDPYIKELLNSGEKELEKAKEKVISASNEHWFDTMTATGIREWENQLAFYTSGTLEERSSQIEARWKTHGKCDLELLQRIAEAWKGGGEGEVKISFNEAIIGVTFIEFTRAMNEIEALQSSIYVARPAHLPLKYTLEFSSANAPVLKTGIHLVKEQVVYDNVCSANKLVVGKEYGLVNYTQKVKSNKAFIRVINGIYKIIDAKANAVMCEVRGGIPLNQHMKKIKGRLELVDIEYPALIEIF